MANIKIVTLFEKVIFGNFPNQTKKKERKLTSSLTLIEKAGMLPLTRLQRE